MNIEVYSEAKVVGEWPKTLGHAHLSCRFTFASIKGGLLPIYLPRRMIAELSWPADAPGIEPNPGFQIAASPAFFSSLKCIRSYDEQENIISS